MLAIHDEFLCLRPFSRWGGRHYVLLLSVYLCVLSAYVHAPADSFFDRFAVDSQLLQFCAVLNFACFWFLQNVQIFNYCAYRHRWKTDPTANKCVSCTNASAVLPLSVPREFQPRSAKYCHPQGHGCRTQRSLRTVLHVWWNAVVPADQTGKGCEFVALMACVW